MLVEPEQYQRLVGWAKAVDHPVHLPEHRRLLVILGYQFGMLVDGDTAAPLAVLAEERDAAVEGHSVNPCRQARLPPETRESAPEVDQRLLPQVVEIGEVCRVEIADLADD